ncbi:DUF1308 domain-containing protein [Dolichospermum sp. UHCC 0352]|uniref:DUF1308 domain-containing protein n=1 Tax=Dolichospermum sp. UHCC 0352 TaxID=2590011 RepID=UPI0020C4DA28|nr:DUF1308 domain-containing protein [Dolichospermum sp. UHCC 0352]
MIVHYILQVFFLNLDIIILGTGDQLNIVTTTADAKAVRAASAQGVDFHVYIHPPFPLTGN